jgi:hypothetical protein
MTLTALPVRLVLYVTDTLDAGKYAGERSLVTEMLERLVHKRLLFLLDAGLYSFQSAIGHPNREYRLGQYLPSIHTFRRVRQ